MPNSRIHRVESVLGVKVVTHLVQALREVGIFFHHPAYLLADITLEGHLALPREPSEDVKGICVDCCVAAGTAAFCAREHKGHVDDKALQAPAVAQRQADDFGEALEDLVVGWDGDAEVLDLAAGALMQGCERGLSGVEVEEEGVFAVEDGAGLLVDQFAGAEEVDEQWVDVLRAWGARWRYHDA